MRVRPRASVVLAAALLLSVDPLAGPARADARAPSQPVLTVSSVTSSGAKLVWTAWKDEAGVVGYRVYRGLGDTPLTLITTTDGNVLAYRATGLRSHTGYRFAVAALDADNKETRSTETTVTTAVSADKAPPGPATTVRMSAFSSSRIDISWVASTATDIAAYDILRNGTVVGTVRQPAATRFSDNGLSPSTTYSYAIRSVDSAGNTSVTAARPISTLASGVVKIVRGPYAVRVGATTVRIVWWTNLATRGTVAIDGSTTEDSRTTVEHQVTVNGLTAGVRYPYTVTSGNVSASGSVRTAPKPGQPFTFSVIGDFGGGGPQEAQNASQIAASGGDFVQTVGDNVYPSSGFPDPDFPTQLSDLDTRIFKQFNSVFRTQAFFPANGNHEYYDNAEFWNAFPMPGDNHSWYSYDWGDAHILVLDSMRSYAPGSPQYQFAKSDLQAARRATWRIVIVPSPPYNTTTSGTAGSSEARSLVPLLQTQDVDLVLSGDAHNYQRTVPMLGKVPDPDGITYVVTGGGGNGLNAINASNLNPMPSWQAARKAVYETLRIEVSPTAVKVSAIAPTGGVIDSTTIREHDAAEDKATAALFAGVKVSATVTMDGS